MNETTYIWWQLFGWLLLWLSSGLWYLIGDTLFKNDYIYGYWRWLVYWTICGVIYYLIGQPIISIPIILVGTYIYINYKIKNSKPSHKKDNIKAELLDSKISTIKLGFKSINHISLTDKDMYDLPDKELKRYYKAGEKAKK